MASSFTVKENIQRPAQEVWDYITDFNNANQWMRGVENFAAPVASEIGRGSRLTFDAGGRSRESVVEYWLPQKCFTLVSEIGGVRAAYTYRVQAAPQTLSPTSLELTVECAFRGFWKLVGPLLLWLIKLSDGSQPNKIKNILESH